MHAVPQPPSAVAVYSWVEKLKAGARGVLRDAMKTSQPLSQQQSRQVRDAAMVCLALCHCQLATRGSVLATCKAPEYADEPCTLPTCPAKRTCLGTRLEASRHNPGQMQLVIPHHKGQGMGANISGPVLQVDDTEVVQLLLGYLRFARPRLVMPGNPDQPQLFLTKDGNPFDDSKICSWWKDLHRYATTMHICVVRMCL